MKTRLLSLWGWETCAMGDRYVLEYGPSFYVNVARLTFPFAAFNPDYVLTPEYALMIYTSSLLLLLFLVSGLTHGSLVQ